MPVTANADGSVTVTFSISDNGNSGLDTARIVAVKNNSGVARLQSTGIIEAVNVGNEIVTSPNVVGTSSYTFSAGTLEYFSPYFFYCACRDKQGWFNNPPGSISSLQTPGLVLGTPIGNNGGRVYDPIPPVITIHKVIAIPSTSTTSSTLKVTYGISESGNSGIASSRIMASLTNVTRDTVLSSTGSYVSNIGSRIRTTEASGYINASYTSSFSTSQLSQLISGPTLVFTNSVPLTITMTFQTTFVTKYTIGSGLQTQAPKDWTMTFFDSQDTQVGSVDTRNNEVFMDNEVRDFAISYGLENVSKAVLEISSIPLSVSRPGVSTFINSAGLIEVAPANTPRYDHDPVTLAAKGLLVETERYNLLSNMSYWTTENSSKTTSTTITPFFDTGDQAILVTGNGSYNVHGISVTYSKTLNFHMFSVYLRRGSNNFAQVANIDGTFAHIFVNFDLLNGTVGTFGSNITVPLIQPAGNGWFRCSFRYNSAFSTQFAIYLVTANNATFRQLNNLTTSIYAAAPQSELGSTSTVSSYIPTGQVASPIISITRAADVVQKDVGLSFLRVYNGPVVNIPSSVVSLTGLPGWQNYRVFASAVDVQGLYDNGSATGGSTIANSFSISNNNGRTWDDSLPEITVSKVEFVNPGVNNSLRVDVNILDSGSSGIQFATIFVREYVVGDSADPKVYQNDIIFGTSGGQRQNVLMNTSSTYNNTTFAIFDLKEATFYRVFVAILDNQGNYNSSPASINSNDEIVRNPKEVSGVPIPNGGITYGLNPYFTTSNTNVFAQIETTTSSISITAGTTVFTHANTCELYLILYPSTHSIINDVTNTSYFYDAVQSNEITFKSKNVPIDSTPPQSSNANVVIENITSSSCMVSWFGFTDNVAITGYDVYINTVDTFSGSTRVASNLSNLVTSYPITNLKDNTIYYSFVVAKDSEKLESVAKRSSSFTTLDGTPPIILNVNVTQGLLDYVLSVRGNVKDNKSGSLQIYMFITLQSVSISDYMTFITQHSVSIPVLNNISYVAPEWYYVPEMSTHKLWNGQEWVEITTGNLIQIHYIVRDIAGNHYRFLHNHVLNDITIQKPFTSSYISSYPSSQLSMLDTGQTLVFTNPTFPLTITAMFPKTEIELYELGIGLKTQAPNEWILTLFDNNDIEVGSVRSSLYYKDDINAWHSESTLDYVNMVATKAVLSILGIYLVVIRPSIATFINSEGLIEVADGNTPRYDYDPISLVNKGLLIEESRTNSITSNYYIWNTSDSTFDLEYYALPLFHYSVYSDYFKMSGVYQGYFSLHNITIPISISASNRTFSIYLRRDTNNFAQISIGGTTTIFANFDLLNGTIGTKGAGNINTIIYPAVNGWYRCCITMTSPVANSVMICLVTSSTASRLQTNSLSSSIYLAGPQLEVGSTVSSYIPTTYNSAVTRSADVIQRDLALSKFKLYGRRDDFDIYAPKISSFSVLKGTSNYIFTISGGTISDNKNGILKIYMYLSTVVISDHLAFVLDPLKNQYVVKNEAFSYTTSPNSVAIPTNLSVSRFWNGVGWEVVTSSTTSLKSYFVARDQSNNTSFATFSPSLQ